MVYRLLFPLAALYALMAAPLWLGFRVRYPGLIDSTLHGHEMLFGFVFAVIAGFLSTRPVRGMSWLLAGMWLAGRFVAVTGSNPAAFIICILFPLMVFIMVSPPLFVGAKRKENLILPLILTALVATDVAWWSGVVWFDLQVQARALLCAIDLIALLLLLIGGRALRAAVGGHIERQGISRRDHRQFRYELPLAALAGGAAIADAFALEAASGTLCIGMAMLALVRVIPWQLHRTVQHPHLWTLTLGHLWLLPGLVLKGIAQLVEGVPVTGMLHGIGIGAIGTLTLVMMARTTTLRAHQPIADFMDIGIAALLVSAAACARLMASFVPAAQLGLLWFTAVAWSCAFLILLVRLWCTPLPARP